MNKFCTNCGSELDENYSSCKACGQLIKREKSPFVLSRKFLTIATGGLLLVALVYLSFGFLTPSDSSAFVELIYNDDGEAFFYHEGELIAIEEEINTYYSDDSFLYNDILVIRTSSDVVLINIESLEMKKFRDIDAYTFSLEHGRISFLEGDELVWLDVTDWEEDHLIVDQVYDYVPNESHDRFYVHHEEGGLSSFDAKGQIIKEKILDEDVDPYYFHVMNDQYLLYSDGDVIIYDLENESRIERYRDGYISTFVRSDDGRRFALDLGDFTALFYDGIVKEFDSSFLYYHKTQEGILTMLYTPDDDVYVFNLEALDEEMDLEVYPSFSEEISNDFNSLITYSDEDDDVTFYTIEKGKLLPRTSVYTLDEEVLWVGALTEEFFFYTDGDEVFRHNGDEEFLVIDDLDKLDFFELARTGEVYIMSEGLITHYDQNGLSTIIHDGRDVEQRAYNIFTDEVFFVDDRGDLFVIKGKEVTAIDEDVTGVIVRERQTFYLIEDDLYAYHNGDTQYLGKDLTVEANENSLLYYQ